MHCTTRTLLSSAFAPLKRSATASLPPPFLLPAFAAQNPSIQTTAFSTTSTLSARKDRNPARGVSALKRTGLKKQKLTSIKPSELPKPVLNHSERSSVEVDDDHGLWEFFPPDRKSMATPEEMHSHGRAWAAEELKNKDWDDLHRLWWTCVKEKNRLATYEFERKRVKNLYGDFESEKRGDEIDKTMKAIKEVLEQRWYTWEDARVAAMEDGEINMYADLDAGENAYVPREDKFEPEEGTKAEGGTELPPPASTRPEVVRV